MTDWTRIQGTQTSAGSGTTNSLSFGAAVSVGTVVVGALFLATGAAGYIGVTTITDEKSNPYRLIVLDGGFTGGAAAGTLVMFRSLHPVTAGNQPTTITANSTVSTTVFWMLQEEFQTPTGATDISLSGYQYMVDDAGATIENFQTLDNDTLVWAVSFSTGVSTTGAGFTAGQGSGTQRASEWKIQATPTNTMSVVWATQTGSAWTGAIAIAPVAQSRWEPIQHAIQRTGTGTTSSLSFPNPVGAGNMIVGSISSDNSGLALITSFQDDKGNPMSLISGTINTGSSTDPSARATWWSGGLLSNAPQTVTVTYSAGQTVNFLVMDEFAPPSGTVGVAIDGTPVNTNNTISSTSITTPDVTTAKSADLAYGWVDNAGAGAKPGNSYSATNGQGSTWMPAYYITGAPGAYNFVGNSNTSTDNDASLAIFSATGVVASSPGLIGLCSC